MCPNINRSYCDHFPIIGTPNNCGWTPCWVDMGAVTAPHLPEVEPARVRASLLENKPTHRSVRSRFGLDEDDRTICRLTERLIVPGWVDGCVRPVDAMFLYDLIAGVGPNRIVEIGTASGVSAAVLLLALHDTGVPVVDASGRPAVLSFDLHPYCYFARTTPVGSAVAEMVPELAHGFRSHPRLLAPDVPGLLEGETVDMAFIDADHRHPCPTADLLALIPALSPGAWVALHDIALAEACEEHNRLTGDDADWNEHGAEWLFEHWPFEKLRGEPAGNKIGGRNIGAIRIPSDRPVTPDDLRALIALPWETEPNERLLGALESG
jgi:predicted O-methyltransferase YrrM